jgi:hypothetical protein
MNTYEHKETVVIEQPTPQGSTITNLTETAMGFMHQVGEKIGLVAPLKTEVSTTTENPIELGQVISEEPGTEEWNTSEQQKPFMERAKETMYQAGEQIGLVSPPDGFTIYSDSKKRVFINEHGQIEEQKALVEKAKETVYQVGEKIGIINPESEKSFTERAKETLYQAGEKVGLVGTAEDVIQQQHEKEKPLSMERAKDEIFEVRENMGLAKPYETHPERGKRIALTAEERKPLSSQKAKEEILEACENLGLAKPVETKPESGKVMQGNTFIKIHLPKVNEPAALRKPLPA